jgi:hypothetical protein
MLVATAGLLTAAPVVDQPTATPTVDAIHRYSDARDGNAAATSNIVTPELLWL